MKSSSKNQRNDVSRNKEEIEKEYDHLIRYETELFKNRWAVFTTLLSISFIIVGFGLQQLASNESNLFSKLVCSFGFLVYTLALYHYLWFHKLAHKLRNRGQELEKELEFKTYEIRNKYSQDKRKFALHRFILFFTFVYIILLFLIWFIL